MKNRFMFCLFLACFYGYGITKGHPFTTKKLYRSGNNMTIAGKVMEEGSNTPVNTTLTIQVIGYNPIETTTDNDGNFSARIPVAEKFKIVIKAEGFESQVNTIEYPAYEEGGSDNIEIRLTPSVKLTLNGLILGDKGRTPMEVQLNVYKFSDFIKTDSQTIRNGKYSQSLTDFGWYMIDFSAPGYVDVKDTVWVMNCSRKVIHKNYYLTSIGKGLTMELNEIHFNFGKTTLRPDSYPELDRLVKFLSRNPTVKIEVAGHTDNEGPADYNLFLSQARAQAVLTYLVAHGINENRVTAHGYGESQPVETNDTLAGKAKNRRVELVVVNE